jgi:hypothetical protein
MHTTTMNKHKPKPISEALEIIRTEEASRVDDGPDVTHLRPSDMRRFVSIFQPRDITFRELDERDLMSDLREAVRGGRPIPPIDVWWSGKHHYIVNGHHRVLAYKQEGKAQVAIPVTVFKGSFEEAATFSIKSNKNNHLKFTSRDRSNAAWKAVRFFDWRGGAEVIARNSDLSVRTIKSMRQVRDKLLKDDPEMTPSDLPVDWLEAQNEARSGIRKETDEDLLDVRRRYRAAEIQQHFMGAFGRLVGKDIELLAMALAGIDKGRFVSNISQSRFWREALEDGHHTDEIPDY